MDSFWFILIKWDVNHSVRKLGTSDKRKFEVIQSFKVSKKVWNYLEVSIILLTSLLGDT